METAAILKHAKFSAQKGRLVANAIRGMPVSRALNTLNFNVKRAAKTMKKVLESAIANAENNNGADVNQLYFSHFFFYFF